MELRVKQWDQCAPNKPFKSTGPTTMVTSYDLPCRLRKNCDASAQDRIAIFLTGWTNRVPAANGFV
jgi:hypothetical protein